MKSILKRNRVLAVIALIGLLASLVPLISRVQAEESNKYYDIVLDYNSMRSMARQSSQSEDEWLDLFKSLGVDKVALSEASALNLHDNAAIPVHAMTVKKAAESYGWEDQYPAEVAHEQMLTDLDARLEPLGYTHATVPAMELKAPSMVLKVLQGIGTAALIVILLDLFFFIGKRWRTILFAVGALGLAGLAVLRPSMFRLILSMSGGIVMPSLAAVGLCRVLLEKRRSEPQIKFGKLLGFTLGAAIATILTAFCGSLLASSALSQLSYILEIDLYRGVKLMQLIPIALFMLAYLLVYAYEETGAREAVLAHAGQRGEKNRVKRFNAYFGELMQTPMKLGWFLAIVVIAVAAVFMLLVFAYYMYRTGNSTTTSARELAFRNFLENTLIARPRTKEMIVGWPMLMLFIWSLRRRMKFLPMIFGTGMTIGLVSVVNTFLHIRTPFLLSLLRTGWGILFGLLIGTAVVIVAELFYRLVRRICGVTNG